MKRRLFFDVSTELMFIGYARGEFLVDFSTRIAQRDHAKYLVDRIDQVLKRNDITLDQIEEIIIGVGPGSYTGLRIAVMVGKMLAYTKNIPLRTVSSLFFLTSGYDQIVAPMMDARRGHVYAMVHHRGETLLQEGYYLLKDLSKHENYRQAETIMIDHRNYLVSIKRIIEQSILVEDVHNLVPNYLRKTEAENKHDQKS